MMYFSIEKQTTLITKNNPVAKISQRGKIALLERRIGQHLRAILHRLRTGSERRTSTVARAETMTREPHFLLFFYALVMVPKAINLLFSHLENAPESGRIHTPVPRCGHDELYGRARQQ
jgi:hypothetical protein